MKPRLTPLGWVLLAVAAFWLIHAAVLWPTSADAADRAVYAVPNQHRLFPPDCPLGGVCIIRDSHGGITYRWEIWGKLHALAGTRFVVEGRCESACFIEMRKSGRDGRLIVYPGARISWGHPDRPIPTG